MNMKLAAAIFLSLSLLAGYINISAAEAPPATEAVAKIERRGRQIADYERASIRATDLLLASNPDKEGLGVYVAVNKDGIWTVFFGRIIDEKFRCRYCYSCPDGKFEEMKPVADAGDASDDVFCLAKAVALALEAVKLEMQVPAYNPSVFKEEDGTITVYLLPGNSDRGVALLGGDFKVSVSGDASRLLDKTKLHQSILRMPLKFKDGRQPLGAFHTHVLSDLPTETDVAVILLNPQLSPHYVAGGGWLSKIDERGKITVEKAN